MVAGGTGLAPFATLSDDLAAAGISGRLFYGARTGVELFYVERFEGKGIGVDAGHRGRHAGRPGPGDGAAGARTRGPSACAAGDGLRVRAGSDARGGRCARGPPRPGVRGRHRAADGHAEWAAATAAWSASARRRAARDTCGRASRARCSRPPTSCGTRGGPDGRRSGNDSHGSLRPDRRPHAEDTRSCRRAGASATASSTPASSISPRSAPSWSRGSSSTSGRGILRPGSSRRRPAC